MSGMFKGEAIGNCGKDLEVRFMADGTPVGRFSMAVNTKTKKDGEYVEETTWITVSIFGKRAESLAQYIVKGQALFVRGDLQVSQYDSTKEPGKKMIDISIKADEVQFMGKAEGGGGGKGGWNDFSTTPPADKPKERLVFGGQDHKEPAGAEPF